MSLLPALASTQDYWALHPHTDTFRPALQVIAERHGLDPGELERTARGGNVVFTCGERVIKLIAPLWPDEHAAEQLLLTELGGRLPLRTPELEHVGELEGWRYFVLEHLPGERIGDPWPRLSADARRSLARQLGELIVALHGLPTAPFTALQPPGGEWHAWRSEQRAGAATRFRAQGASEAWVEQVEALLADVPEPPARDPVLLDGDLTDDHLRVEETPRGWRITGLFDFADAMLGHPHYELAAPSVFLTAGDRDAQRELLLGVGFDAPDLDADLARRLTAEVLLHRFANLPAILRRLGEPRDLPALQRALWDLDT